MEIFRQGIVAVLINDDGKILMGERSDRVGSWQFPQGGIERGESPSQAFYRELEEELGNNRVELLKMSSGKTVYRWPNGGSGRAGQEQIWFLARFKPGEGPQLDLSDGSFSRYKWEVLEAVLPQIVDWKRESFRKGFEFLGLLPETEA